ncbi:MAG: hypothetical protein NT147_05030, partial [Candidatus Aminicenantes bacterium]|nr:hypothetical protein [Candidatus Aminicenantes bacterium]
FKNTISGPKIQFGQPVTNGDSMSKVASLDGRMRILRDTIPIPENWFMSRIRSRPEPVAFGRERE